VVNSKLRSDFSGSAVNVSRRGLSGVTGAPLTANWPPLSAASSRRHGAQPHGDDSSTPATTVCSDHHLVIGTLLAVAES
jgi:hypothetical protein